MKNIIHRTVKEAILSMLEESDTLDYSVVHTPDKTGCSIFVSRETPRQPLFRVTLSQPSADSEMLGVSVRRGSQLDTKLMDTQFLGGINSGEIQAKVLEAITHFIENVDNGRDVTGTPAEQTA